MYFLSPSYQDALSENASLEENMFAIRPNTKLNVKGIKQFYDLYDRFNGNFTYIPTSQYIKFLYEYYLEERSLGL